ncbi:MAG: PPOX class F420-dependent oxidoreductase [Frankia sp.]
MTFTDAQRDYLASQPLGRLATLAPNGTPQVKPVGFRYNEDLGTIDISGFAMESSAKFRNIKVHPAVSFVVDDRPNPAAGADGVRFLEIRGEATPATREIDPADPDAGHLSSYVIRIRPVRVVAYNV